ncbi:MAG TPA: site-specific integrase, partial [Mycobacterium sp.]|nr:site-specific integrase [Mycobacterium sp.]
MSARSTAAADRRAAARTWTWPVDTVCYDRCPDLSPAERVALGQLGANVRRRRGYDRDAPQWRVIGRLLRPLDDARAAMWCPDSRYYQRAITDAIGMILMRCAENGTTFWGWSDQDWVRLIGTDAREFERSWPGWVDGTIRPYLTAYAYLLTDFTSFQLLGHTDKQPLAWRVFGKDVVDNVVEQVAAVLNTWGYRVGSPHDDRFPTVVCLVLLLNRSPRLEDLDTEAFERLRRHPALVRWHIGALHGLQRAVAALGHCEPPSMAKHGSMPAIEGTNQQWADWVERWYATSTLTPKVRAIFRGTMAKAGRWLAAEHPEIVEPGQW